MLPRMILRGHGTRRILRAGRMAAAAKPIYAAQAGTDCSIASLLVNCPTRDVRFTPKSGHRIEAASECMRWPVKQFELCGQHRDTQISLGAREVRLKCLWLIGGLCQPLERCS